jgi:tripartite-type tricarboxylate transporter receptor subunit TctC
MPLLAATAALGADDYPSRSIRVISPFPLGSASDRHKAEHDDD